MFGITPWVGGAFDDLGPFFTMLDWKPLPRDRNRLRTMSTRQCFARVARMPAAARPVNRTRAPPTASPPDIVFEKRRQQVRVSSNISTSRAAKPLLDQQPAFQCGFKKQTARCPAMWSAK